MNGSTRHLAIGLVLAALGGTRKAWAVEQSRPERPEGRRDVPTSPGLLGRVRAGPMIGISAPDGLGVGMIAKYKILGIGLFASYLPFVSLPGLDAQLARMSLGTDVRVYPFGGAFFLGVGVGYSQMKGTAERKVRAYRQDQTALGSVFTSAGWVGPELGFLCTVPVSSRAGAPRISFGTDVALAIPFGATEPRFAVTKYGLTMDIDGIGKLAEAVRFVQTHPTPVLNLLRVGVLL